MPNPIEVLVDTPTAKVVVEDGPCAGCGAPVKVIRVLTPHGAAKGGVCKVCSAGFPQMVEEAFQKAKEVAGRMGFHAPEAKLAELQAQCDKVTRVLREWSGDPAALMVVVGVDQPAQCARCQATGRVVEIRFHEGKRTKVCGRCAPEAAGFMEEMVQDMTRDIEAVLEVQRALRTFGGKKGD